MKINRLSIPDVILIKPDIFTDHRGSFMESYHKEKYYHGGIKCDFIQDNYAISIQNTLRGLHFQKQFPQAKLISCLKGEIFDVAVIAPAPPLLQTFNAKLSDPEKSEKSLKYFAIFSILSRLPLDSFIPTILFGYSLISCSITSKPIETPDT